MTLADRAADLLWLIPALISVSFVVAALLWRRRHSAISTVYFCFALAVIEILVGAAGTWLGGRYILAILGIAGEISPELVFESWLRSWDPFLLTAASSAVLLLLAYRSVRSVESWEQMPHLRSGAYGR